MWTLKGEKQTTKTQTNQDKQKHPKNTQKNSMAGDQLISSRASETY
jgi:hypothetical protein